MTEATLSHIGSANITERIPAVVIAETIMLIKANELKEKQEQLEKLENKINSNEIKENFS